MKRGTSVMSVVSAIVLSGAILAQNPMNDGFSAGPCCSPAFGNLPIFPTMAVTGLGASIADCGVESQFGTSVTLIPVQVLSDYAFIVLTIDAQPAFSITNQFLAAKYARTWLEVSSVGDLLQIWRFLVNGDLVYSPGPAGGAGNPIPLSALPPYNLPVHFIGNVDFVQDLDTGGWEVAYTLTHFCPIESHAAVSQRPIPAASTWPNRTYHFVGPSNFVFDPFPSTTRVIVGESSRTSSGLVSGGPYTSFNEATVQRGIVVDQGQACIGGNGPTTASIPRYTHQYLGLSVQVCGSVSQPLTSVPTALPTLPTGLRGLSIGRYTSAAGSLYPAEEYISVHLGVLSAPEVCPNVPSPSLHIVTGVGTAGGNPVILFDEPLPVTSLGALDLHDVNVLTPAGFMPGFGSLFGSEHVWSFTLL